MSLTTVFGKECFCSCFTDEETKCLTQSHSSSECGAGFEIGPPTPGPTLWMSTAFLFPGLHNRSELENKNVHTVVPGDCDGWNDGKQIAFDFTHGAHWLPAMMCLLKERKQVRENGVGPDMPVSSCNCPTIAEPNPNSKGEGWSAVTSVRLVWRKPWASPVLVQGGDSLTLSMAGTALRASCHTPCSDSILTNGAHLSDLVPLCVVSWLFTNVALRP